MSDKYLDLAAPPALSSPFTFKTVELSKGHCVGTSSAGHLSVIDLQVGILELFGEAQQRSNYFCAYSERDSFTVRRGSGGSVYRCELCGSLATEHRCPFSDQAPPEGFTCLAHRPYRALTVNELERQRTANRERYRRQPRLVPLPKELRGGRQCGACGARAPQHRCIEEKR